MRKLFSFLFIALMISVGAAAETYTITFATSTQDGSVEIKSNANLSTVISSGAQYVDGFGSGCLKAYYACKNGVKLGSSSASGTLVMNIAADYQAGIKKIIVRTAAYGTDNGTISMAVNGTNVKSGIAPADGYVHTFSTATTVSSISLMTSSKRAYVSEIVLETEETYSLSIDNLSTQGGTITLDKTQAAAGETITITGVPTTPGDEMVYAAAYKAPSWYPFVEATIGTNNTATFTMPAYDAVVYALFDTPEDEVETILVSVSLSGTPSKTQYEIGESFSTEGLVLTAHYLDENNNEIDRDVTAQATWTIDPEGAFSTAGTETVTVLGAFGGEDDVDEYQVTVVKKTAVITPAVTTMNLEVGDRESLECTTTPAGLPLVYAIANQAVATTHEEVQSTIIAQAAGTTTCTISFAGNDTYAAASATVTINVTDPDDPGTDEPVDTDCGTAVAGTYSITPNNALWGTEYSGTITEATAATALNGGQSGICMEYKKGSGNYMFVNDSQTRAYGGNTLSFSVPEGYLLTAIAFTADGSNWNGAHEASAGTMTDNKHWTGEEQSVTITFKGTCRIAGIQVTYTAAGETPVEPEDVTNTQETAYTVAEALEIIDNRADNNSATQQVYVSGTIKEISELSAQYGNATYIIEDAEGNELTVFRGKWLEGAAFTQEMIDDEILAVGDEVIVYGKLILYQKQDQDGVYEMNQGNHIVWHNRPEAEPEVELGDVNMDGAVDVSDISTLAEYIFGNTPAQFSAEAADANGDGAIDVSDISTIAEIIFGN